MPLPNIPSIPSAPTSMSETETDDDERRRILEGIFAEQDDDEDDDDIDSNSGIDDGTKNDSTENDNSQDGVIIRDDHSACNDDSNTNVAAGAEWSAGTTPSINNANAPSATAVAAVFSQQVSTSDNTYLSSSSDEDEDYFEIDRILFPKTRFHLR